MLILVPSKKISKVVRSTRMVYSETKKVGVPRNYETLLFQYEWESVGLSNKIRGCSRRKTKHVVEHAKKVSGDIGFKFEADVESK